MLISEPLSLLLLGLALLTTTLSSAFHYHQFGEPTRLARDASVSAVLVFTIIFAAFGAIKTFRREIESGTAALALSHAVSRRAFYLAKSVGILLSMILFSSAIMFNATTIVNGARLGGELAKGSGDIARLYGPSFLVSIVVFLMPLVLSALLNRFARFRFTLSAFLMTCAFSALSLAFRFDAGVAYSVTKTCLLAFLPAMIVGSVASAASALLKSNFAGAIVAIAIGAMLPIMINFTRLAAPFEAMIGALVMIAAVTLIGVELFNKRDLL